MGYQDEEEGPCIHHRSMFDTIPAPPSFAARKPSEPTLLSARGEFTGKGDDGESVRVSANGRAAFPLDEPAPLSCDATAATLAFPGGTIAKPKPTREELLLSAKQWATAVRECLVDDFGDLKDEDRYLYMTSKLSRLDAVLKEMADATE